MYTNTLTYIYITHLKAFTQIKCILELIYTESTQRSMGTSVGGFSKIFLAASNRGSCSVSSLCILLWELLGLLGTFWSRIIWHTWEPSEKLEGACCCQVRMRKREPGGHRPEEALSASNEHDELPLTQGAWSLCCSCPCLRRLKHPLAGAQERAV